MTRKQQRIAAIILIVLGAALAAGLSLAALRQNVTYFMSPTELASTSARPFPGDGRTIRLGGMVKEGSIHRDGKTTHFIVTDFENEIPAIYHGVTPDLFTENSGVVATGVMDRGNVFQASQILARHDENYMPPEVAKMMEGKAQ